MDKLNATGMQRYAAVRIAALGPILQIALDGETRRCQLATYLVVTTCHELHFQQRIAVT